MKRVEVVLAEQRQVGLGRPRSGLPLTVNAGLTRSSSSSRSASVSLVLTGYATAPSFISACSRIT